MNSALSAAHFFVGKNELVEISPFGSGNINKTFLVTLKNRKPLILQRVSETVFPRPELVHTNVRLVCDHLRQATQSCSGSARRFTPMELFLDGQGDFFQDQDGGFWRMLHLLPGRTLEQIHSPAQAAELGRCLGVFHRLLSDLDPGLLVDTLPGFHATSEYLNRFDRAMIPDGSTEELLSCSRFIEKRRRLARILENSALFCHTLIHGDPKVANFLFDDQQQNVVSLIDLDTVRQGLLLHDIGDALRSCCNQAGESPAEDVPPVFSPDLFSAWLKGYIDEAGFLLTDTDKMHIVQAFRLLAFELGVRFVTDHLEGNRYFTTSFPGQNLARAHTQFQLVLSIEQQEAKLNTITRNIFET